MLKTLKFVSRDGNFSASPWLLLKTITRTMSTSNVSENSNSALKMIFSEAVKSVQPAALIQNKLKLVGRHLAVNSQIFPLPKACYAVGFGKAVLGMAMELEQTLQDRLQRAIVTVPKGIFQNYPQFLGKSEKILFIEGAENNIPDKEAAEGAGKIKELVESLSEDDLLIVLISGGGSALLPLPKPPITLEEKQVIIKGLSRAGATIQELNTVRKELSLLKGGGLAKLAYPAKVVSLILSDIVGDPIDMIASGPTVYSEKCPQRAIEILKNYDLYCTAPTSIKTVLESLAIQSTDGKDETTTAVTPSQTCDNSEEKSFPNKEFRHVSNFIIGTNGIAIQTAKRFAVEMGWQGVVVSRKVEEDVDQLAEIYAELAWLVSNGKIGKLKELLENLPFELEENVVEDVLGLYSTRKTLLIFAGEPTVLVTGSGKGGRNQQLALALSLQLNKLTAEEESTSSGNISLLSAGTDGIDGPTDAAGAIGYSGLAETCARLDINADAYLRNNDSYGFYSQFLDGERLVKTGHTGTNVMDLHFLLIEPAC